MVVVLIQTTLREGCDLAAYEALNARMYELAQGIPGFLGADSAGELGLVRFESLAALKAWRDHPEHAAAQERGRRELYASYKVEVCEIVRAYEFDCNRGRTPA